MSRAIHASRKGRLVKVREGVRVGAGELVDSAACQ